MIDRKVPARRVPVGQRSARRGVWRPRGDLRISFRIVRVCTIEQTTLMEARNIRERPRTPTSDGVPGVAEKSPPHGAFGSRDPSQRPRRRVGAKTLLNETDG